MNYNNKLLESWIKILPYTSFKNNLNNLNNNIKSKFENPIGLYDPLGENINPLTNKPYENLYQNKTIEYSTGPLIGNKVPMTYKNLAYNWTNFLVYPNVTKIMNSIRENQVTLAKAGTGTGKTVLIPKIALQAFNFQKKVIVCIPKTKATREAAEFAAICLDVKLGEEVGYYYRGKQMMSSRSKLIFTTTGSLVSKIAGSDPYLDEYSCIVIDEAHERSVQTDFIFLYIKKAILHRPDLKLVIMSATINLEAYINYFPKENFKFDQVDAGEETLFKIEDYYEPKPIIKENDINNEAVNKIMKILNSTESGDILVFVKSGGDGNKIITALKTKLKGVNRDKINPFCVILESKTDEVESKLAIDQFKYLELTDEEGHKYTRKIVASTNIAESSVTINGLSYVIDTGYNYVDKYFPSENASALISEYASQSAVKQRRGRAGRVKEGFCYHLYSKEQYEQFEEFPIPDIQKSDLTNDMLNLLRLEYIHNVGDMKNMLNELIAPPRQEFVDMGMKILYAMGCIDKITDDGVLTEMGNAIAKFRGIDDVLSARAIIASYYLNCKREVIAIIVLCQAIENRIDKLFLKPDLKRKITNDMIKRGKAKFSDQYGDMMTLLNIYNALKDYMRNNYDKSITSKPDQIKAARDWCNNYGINSRVFVSTKDFKKRKRGSEDDDDDENTNSKKFNWDKTEITSQDIIGNLLRIIQPAELRKEYINEYKKEEGIKTNNSNLNKILNNEIKEDQEVILGEKGNNLNTLNKKMVGGYNAKPYELNLFPNLVEIMKNNKQSRDVRKNISLALCQGYFINLAKHISSKTYQTVFPLVRKKCMPDQNSTLNKGKVKPNIIMYNELFMRIENQPILKMNICNSIPQTVLDSIKNDYKEFISYAFTKKIELNEKPSKDLKSDKSHKSQKSHKSHKSIKKSKKRPF